MLDAVNITQAMNGANLSALRAAAAISKPVQPEKAAAQPVENQIEEAVDQETPVEQRPLSPRLRPDLIAGTVVTEFVNSSGQVSQQVPSQAALAYLRAGLTATGQNVPSDIEKFVSERSSENTPAYA